MKSLLPFVSTILISFAFILNTSAALSYSAGLPTAADDAVPSGTKSINDTVTAELTVKQPLPHDSAGFTPDITNSLSDSAQLNVSAEGQAGKKRVNSLDPVLFIIISLLFGAAARCVMHKSPIPYTVGLLFIGLLLGAANRMGWFDAWHLGSITLNLNWLERSIGWAGRIHPRLILFILLPVIVFKATFSVDLHTFRKTFVNAFLLGVPGLIIAFLLTALIVMVLKAAGLGFGGWEWPVAFLFGTVVSAADPAAIGFLRKMTGTGRNLGALFEGEILLNAGTAIFIFLMIFFSVTGAGSESSEVARYIWAIIGGTFVGLISGWFTVTWVRKVLNDAFIEISVITVFAFLTYYVAEHFIHASGVPGLVAYGLITGIRGKTRISPEGVNFLDKFWELVVFFTNTLIFIVAGIVIGGQLTLTANDLLMLLILYIGIHAVRAVVILVLYPLMSKTGYSLNRDKAWVLWYGALRGTIALALALIVAGKNIIPEEIRDNFLFLTTGLVTLTLLINASTIRFLARAVGLTKLTPLKALMTGTAKNYLRQSTENSIIKFKEDRFLKPAYWDVVNECLPPKGPVLKESETRLESAAIDEIRLHILEKEKSSYWNQFREGMLGQEAARRLSEVINEMTDTGELSSLANRKNLEWEWKIPRIFGWLYNKPVIGWFSRRYFFEQLATSFDMARAFIEAQEESLMQLESMLRTKDKDSGTIDKKNLPILEEEVNENKVHGLTFLRNFRNSYPGIYDAIATRQAIRSVLNYEKRMVERMLDKGLIDSGESVHILSGIDKRMKKMAGLPWVPEPPKPVELLREISWLNGLDDQVFNQVVDQFRYRVYPVDAILVKENGPGNGLFIITRGQVKVQLQEHVVDTFGPGSIMGEMAVLTGMPRTATVKAETPVTVLWMSTKKMKTLMRRSKDLENRLWKFACTRFAMNLLSVRKPYNEWQQKEFRQWLAAGEIMYPDNHGNIALKGKVGILLTGQATNKARNETLSAPTILESDDYVFSSNTRVFIREK